MLSQYLTAIQCCGSMPPQETGLTVNSWYGKFHLEMHWWHAAHFAVWNRLPLLEKSLAWYHSILPAARRTAAAQGYAGARWPKMVGPEGRDSPSPVGPLLIWQQPHPIFYAELCRRVLGGSGDAQAIWAPRLRVGGIHGFVCFSGSEIATVRTRAACHPGSGEPSPSGNVESDVRTGLLGLWAEHRSAMARASGDETQLELG